LLVEILVTAESRTELTLCLEIFSDFSQALVSDLTDSCSVFVGFILLGQFWVKVVSFYFS
jgi:hypothetical protein